MQDSSDLLVALKKLGYLQTTRDPLWWPSSGTFEVAVGALLTQQSKWEKVEESLTQLKIANLLTLEALSTSNIQHIASLIKPSGFYNTKAQRLILLSQNILNDFGSFDTFVNEVDRTWLLSQKGIGMESADSILCYACHRAVFVVDSYTQRLLGALGYEFDTYMDLQEWMQQGIEENFHKIEALYGKEMDLATVYARFHGKIVEYAKRHIRGKKVDVVPLIKALEESK
ncbi:3-methyladenine DNA glycosylase [Sulfurovum sp. zt1-1]|uniref:3-methyladenine DNA glycosylase n=1 Tax=Sulfurovum zhangzhouensis TaxID=3019067 RepID=A0ABT7QYM3_9BACT|nr:3-methyladenine DNA glycosylase [Sulfurovum zhangzhouensis]MDM5271930.1 3-methyladenine DNA glycosylase [Sulfurovum zhangzhouensis]